MTDHRTEDESIENLRHRLEQAAEQYGRGLYTWSWDETRMHLTLTEQSGEPVVTLHIELTQ